jgi:hypothetical protein
LLHGGNSSFFVCPVNDNNEWNIYKHVMTAPNQCVEVSLSASCESHSPPLPKCCDDCTEHEWECKKTCYEKSTPSSNLTSSPSPTPKCYDDCSKSDHECLSACYHNPKHSPSSTPKVCDDCHHRDWDCKKFCFRNPKPSSFHSTTSHSTITHPHHHHSTASHCSHCEHHDHECRKTCYKTIKSTTTTTSTDTRKHRPTVKPKKVCFECKGTECDENCAPLLLPPCSILPSNDLSKRSENNVVESQRPTLGESAYNGKPHCSSCEKHDEDCEKKCTVVEITKETVICTDCEKHNEPHRCKHECVQPHLKPVCCDDCKKGDDSCKKNCFEKAKLELMPAHTNKAKPTHTQPVCCDECKEDEHDCKKTCYDKPHSKSTHSSKPTSTIHPKPVCDDCKEEEHECKKTCSEKPKPTAHCNDCKDGDHRCIKTCYPHSRPSLPPSPPKHTPKPLCCDECKDEEWECIKTCYPPSSNLAKPSSKSPPKSAAKPAPCCHECKHEEFDCHKVCVQTCEHASQTPHPTHTAQAPWQHPAAPSHGKIPGQLYGACPADLHGEYQSPHLIIPVSSAEPNKAYGSSYNAYTSDVKSTIFNFDLPKSYEGKTCSLFFMLPNHEDLKTSNYTLSGSGTVHFDLLLSTATADTTNTNQPSKALHLNNFPLVAGTTYWIADHPCPGGESVAFEMSASGVDLEYFQDWNPSPIGLYIRAC